MATAETPWHGLVVFPGIIRRAVAMSTARHAAGSYGDRILRQSSTLRVASEVWSDVASARGLGFREEEETGPLLHGELRSGGAVEMGISFVEDGQYATLAAARLNAPLKGSVVVRPNTAWTRVLGHIQGPPAGVSAELTSAFHVRAKPADRASVVLTPKVQELLTLLIDRRPELHAQGEEVLLVLEGVELVHERVEAIVDAFETLFPVASGPYR